MARGIGEYRFPVLILRRVLAASDTFGEEVESWPEAGAVRHYAKIEELSGTMQMAGAVRGSSVTSRVSIMKPVAIDAVDRIKREDTGEVLVIGGLFRSLMEVVLSCSA